MKIIFLFFCLFTSLNASEDVIYTCLDYPSFSINPFKQVKIHILKINPEKYTIKPVKALDNGVGRESVLSMALRTGAVAAINGGFFSSGGLYDGLPAGALKIKDWYSLPSKFRGCIGWSANDQIPCIDNIAAVIECHYQGKKFNLHGLNRVRQNREAILFTSNFHKTTLTKPDGEEIVIDANGTVRRINNQTGSSLIPENGCLLSIQSEHPMFGKFQVGKKIAFDIKVNSKTQALKKNWKKFDYILGGTPVMLMQGKKINNFNLEGLNPNFLMERRSRTAIGILPNNYWVLIVVERKWNLGGMTIPELTHFMKEMGCVDALNLDGGRSSSIVYQNQLKNSPGGEEFDPLCNDWIRRVTDAIIVIPK